ncbi:hypothetical protein GGD55_006245 [Rhizobium giardinii]|uniref:Uncharacterized protein n=1 Tax=Rhizobium giardinii TaxID=56731 RepID=A0A7W8XAL3_9HYPH|nr:hypothetical protein [Rhizobium giardinii]
MNRVAAAIFMVLLMHVPSDGASRKIQGSSLNFSCDVNTNRCTCTGEWEGADCKVMNEKVCAGDSGVLCTPTGCTCKMRLTSAPKSRIDRVPIGGARQLAPN